MLVGATDGEEGLYRFGAVVFCRRFLGRVGIGPFGSAPMGTSDIHVAIICLSMTMVIFQEKERCGVCKRSDSGC